MRCTQNDRLPAVSPIALAGRLLFTLRSSNRASTAQSDKSAQSDNANALVIPVSNEIDANAFVIPAVGLMYGSPGRERLGSPGGGMCASEASAHACVNKGGCIVLGRTRHLQARSEGTREVLVNRARKRYS